MSLWSRLFGGETRTEEWRAVQAEEAPRSFSCDVHVEDSTRTYTLAVVGVSHENDDGTPRQEIIRRCKTADQITLRREPENPYDLNAIAVTTATGEQIGYLSRDNAEWVAPVLEEGKKTTAVIKSVSPAEGAPDLQGVLVDLTLHYSERPLSGKPPGGREDGTKSLRKESKPGFVDGRHYTTYVEEFKQLKREDKLEHAEALLLQLVEATEAEARAEGWCVAPGYYEHLAIVYRKQKRLADEIAILERYERQTEAPGTRSAKLAQRLAKQRDKHRP